MEGAIKFKYTLDGGTTWSTQTIFDAARLHAWLRFERDDNISSDGASGTICIQGTPRLVVSVDLNPTQFLPGVAGDALLLYINKLRCASMIHLETGVAFDGFSEWTSGSNTVYLTPDDIPDIVFDESTGDIRTVAFSLQARDPYVLT